MYTTSLRSIKVTQLLVVHACVLSACSVKKEQVSNYSLVEQVHNTTVAPVTFGTRDVSPLNVLRIYIEGDGRAWINKYTPSNDPTPSNSLVLKLMQVDPAPAVYLARPCMYALNDQCIQYHWTEGRHSVAMVNAMNDTVDAIKKRYSAKEVEFIGHSGGGAMAVLIAAKRSDVKRMITVAGNLDIHAFVEHHNVTPMEGSLNPKNYARRVKDIPQLHLAGSGDKAVPPTLWSAYKQAVGPRCAQFEVFADHKHIEGWVEDWPAILKKEVACEKIEP